MGKFDSEKFYERLYLFGRNCLFLVRSSSRNIYLNEYNSQLIRSSASVGANYIEALEALSKKDFIHRLKISRKEARESIHWLRLLKEGNSNPEIPKLIKEAEEIKNLLSSSILTLEKKTKTD